MQLTFAGAGEVKYIILTPVVALIEDHSMYKLLYMQEIAL